ncbi:hypothetical protein Ddye_023051 [Dipteronia dyeriana]|uniref:Protein kinase domain-containing protein n=1 Tax=Dipteronia dyeriana TaxID=168575 RepID=A0AAD9TT69_9ROSI|nr:hypothetical protein Ddye_023051 [Dipteronia dyeriana]
MVAYVGDFGLEKLLSGDPLSAESGTQSRSIGIKGTMGYVAPQYGIGSQVSMPGDVYSFGIFLLEMFTGKHPTDSMFDDKLTLYDFAKTSLLERVIEIIEPSLLLKVTIDNNNMGGVLRDSSGKILCVYYFFPRDYGLELSRNLGYLKGLSTNFFADSMAKNCSVMRGDLVEWADRMKMTDVVAKLCAIRENFLNKRIRDVRHSG